MDGLFRPVEGDDDGQADRHFGGGDGDGEKNEQLTVVVRQSVDQARTAKMRPG